MSKFITKELMNANMSRYIKADDIKDNPVQLNLITLKPVTRTKQNGETFEMNEYGFLDAEGQEKFISDFLGGSLWQAVKEIDPEENSLLEIWSEEVEGFKYPQFRAKLIGQEILNDKMNKVEAAGRKVLADKAKIETSDEEEIKIEDIPF